MTQLTCGIFLVDPEENISESRKLDSSHPAKFPENFANILVCHATNSPWNSWGIPKGLPDPGEDTKTAAIRELQEETSIVLSNVLDPDKDLHYLGTSDYKNRKKTLVAYWGFIGEPVPLETLSCSSMVTDKGDDPFPEVDKYQWMSLEKALTSLHLAQRNILPKLVEAIKEAKKPPKLPIVKIPIKKLQNNPVQTKIKIVRKGPAPLAVPSQQQFIKTVLPHGNSWVVACTNLPPEVQMNAGTFQEIWALHPKEYAEGIMFGKIQKFPRWQESFGQSYYYTGLLHKSHPIDHPFLKSLLAWVCKHSGQPYKQILINWYQDGNHYIGEHSDDESQLVPQSSIYSFSYGQERDFVVKSKDKSYRNVFKMPNNSLLIMGGEMQKYYKHSVPKRSPNTCPNPRINITFRLFV